MIFFLYASELDNFGSIQKSMFADRAEMFSRRLGWDVTVSSNGAERDQYDELEPLYVVHAGKYSTHEGSMRLMPTTGRTMLNEHFKHLLNGNKVTNPKIWECTRFCTASTAPNQSSFKVLAAAAFLMRQLHLASFVGIFDEKVERLYSRLGVSPQVLGRDINQGEKIAAGIWCFEDPVYYKLLRLAGLSEYELQLSFEYSSIGKAYHERYG